MTPNLPQRGIVRVFNLHRRGSIGGQNLPRGAVKGGWRWGNIKLMEAAIALAEELNFSRAAQKLHITQPALAKRMAELEDRLGISLFTRDHQMVDVMTRIKLSLKRLGCQCSTAREYFKLRREQRGVLTLSSTTYSSPPFEAIGPYEHRLIIAVIRK
jgi:hypothetical protein